MLGVQKLLNLIMSLDLLQVFKLNLLNNNFKNVQFAYIEFQF